MLASTQFHGIKTVFRTLLKNLDLFQASSKHVIPMANCQPDATIYIDVYGNKFTLGCDYWLTSHFLQPEQINCPCHMFHVVERQPNIVASF